MRPAVAGETIMGRCCAQESEALTLLLADKGADSANTNSAGRCTVWPGWPPWPVASGPWGPLRQRRGHRSDSSRADGATATHAGMRQSPCHGL